MKELIGKMCQEHELLEIYSNKNNVEGFGLGYAILWPIQSR